MARKAKYISLALALIGLLCLCACGAQGGGEAQPVDMQAVYDSIAQQLELPQMMELSEKRMSNYYGIEASECPQAVVMLSEAGLSVDEIWLIEASGDEEAARIEEVALSHITQLCAETEKYSPELYAVCKNGQVIRQGANVALFISPDAEAMASIFREALGK